MALEIQFDGGSRGNPGPAAAGVVLHDHRQPLLEAGYVLGEMTNNQAEYNALLIALLAAEKLDPSEVVIRSDSELIVRQILGQYRVKSPDLKPLHEQAVRILHRCKKWSIQHVRRNLNSRADALVNKALDAGADVIEIDRVGVKPSRAPDRPRLPHSTRVEVRVLHSAADGVCPAGCQTGDIFLMTDRPSPDLCLDGCAAVIRAAIALRDGHDIPDGDAFTCGRKGCGARFLVKRAD